ncbi:MAG: hypothetical protein HQ564_10565 [Candidatus Saganbacteria bacterium]|nr:hypothetical protein [Candidatus Saganbacteria bacterium]
MFKYIICLLLIFMLAVPSGAAIAPFIDTWNRGGYFTTNTEIKNFNAVLGRSEIRAGIFLTDDLEDIPPIGPYYVSLLVTSKDPNYWNNQLATGYGVRILPFVNYEGTNWADEWIKDIKVFAEILTLTNLVDDSTAIANGVPTTDKRVGLDLYHEWNQDKIDKNIPWTDIWANISIRSTNLHQDWRHNYLLRYLQKTGWHMEDNLMPYLKAELFASGLTQPWWNNLQLGAGLDVAPFKDDKESLLNKLKIYIEYTSIIWYKESDSRPQSDFRFGVEYRLYRK